MPVSRFKWLRRLFGFAIICAAVFAAWSMIGPAKPALGNPPSNSAGVSVEVITPKPGGTERVCSQPGTVEPFQSADLYAKVSGFLIEQSVDIGDRVKAGDILARIAVPEHEKQVKQDAAEVARSKAKVDQMAAAIITAEADLGAATAAIALAQADLKSKASFRSYREKQWERIKGLVANAAIDAKLADEHEDQFQAAVSAELATREAVSAAQQKEAAARARVKQAQADLRYAESEVVTAQVRLEKSQVLFEYSVLRSPYTGVVTRRNFHPGDFVRSADSGGERTPVLAVERTDIMRVVIQVPERDVPFVDLGDQAVVVVDALPGIAFKSQDSGITRISRLAASEDPHTRMMRTEVHVLNPDGKIRRGMYGRVILTLDRGVKASMRIPSTAISGKADGGKATIRVVRDGKVHLVPIRYGADNGSEVEVLSGLEANDKVVIGGAGGPLAEGDAVIVSEAKLSSSH